MHKLLCVLLLAGCASTAPQLDDQDVIKTARQSLVKAATITRPTVIKTLRTDKLLLSSVEVVSDKAPVAAVMEVVSRQIKSRSWSTFLVPKTDYYPVTVTHKGPLKDLLPRVEAQSGLAVRVNGNTLLWNNRITKVFEIARLPGNRSFKIGSDSDQNNQQSSESADSSGLSQNTQFSMASSAGDMWGSIAKSLKSIADEKDADINMQPALSSVSVSGTPAAVREIGITIADLNERLRRQVSIDIQVVQVTLTSGTALGIDWKAVRETARNASTISSQPLTLDTTGTLSFSLIKQTGEYTGSELIISALQEQGTVHVVTEPQLMVLNYEVVEQRLISETGYLASTTPGDSGLSGSSTPGLTPGTVVDGMSLGIQVSIGVEDILLHTSVSIANLDELSIIRSGDQIIQTPILSKTLFNEQTRARDGETLIISGFRQVSSRSSEAQPGRATWLKGSKAKRAIIETVLLVTPRRIR